MIEAMAVVLLSIAAPDDGLLESLRKCREIADDRSRLECFDEAFLLAEEGTAGEPPPATESPASSAKASPASSATESQTEGSKVDAGEGIASEPSPAAEPSASSAAEASPGSSTVDAETPPEDGPTTSVAVVPARGGGRKLSVRCDAGELSVAIDWGQYLRSDAPQVTVRIDSLPPSSSKWARSEDKQASVLKPLAGKQARQEKIARFVSELVAGQRLAARVIPGGATAVTAVFDLSGAKGELRSVRRACW